MLLGYGPSRDEPRISGFEYRNIPLWDCSGHPTTNDRFAKLGRSAAGARGLAIADYDSENDAIEIASGFDRAALSIAHFEPDSHAFVDHGGIDKVWQHRDIVDHQNTVKSIKHRTDMVIDQQNLQSWAYKQDQWWVVKIKKFAPPIPKGREYNSAGFLPSLYGQIRKSGGSFKAAGNSGATFVFPTALPAGGDFRVNVETVSNQAEGPTRGTLSLNTNQRAGTYSDGKGVGQLAQLFHFMPIEPADSEGTPVPTGGKKGWEYHLRQAQQKRQREQLEKGGGTGPSTPFDPKAGQVFSDPDERGEYLDGEREKRDQAPLEEKAATEESGGKEASNEVEPRMGALRGDVLLDLDGVPCHFAIQDVNAAMADVAYFGAFLRGRPQPMPPKYVPAEDRTSDQPKLKRPPQMPGQRGIRPWIKIPKDTGVPPQCGVQPHFDPAAPSYSTTGVLPGWHTGTGSDAGVYRPPAPLVDRAGPASDFPDGYVTAIEGSFLLPSTRTDMRFLVEVPYVLPTNLAGAEVMDFRFYYKVVSGIGQTAGEDWTEITRQLTAGDNPATAHQVKCLKFEVPAIHFSRSGGGGGRLHFWFMRRSDDTATGKKFRLVGNIQSSFEPAYNRRTLGYGGAA